MLWSSQYFLKAGFEETTLSKTTRAAGTSLSCRFRNTKERFTSFTLEEYAFVMSPFRMV